MRKFLGPAILTLALGLPAQAAPNFLGSSGLLLTPDASVAPARSFGAHLHGHSDFESIGVLGGLSDRLEVGVTYLNLDDDVARDDEGILVNAKFALLQETTVTPGFAVGVVDLFDELDADPSWYAVASKAFPRFLPVLGAIRAHVGFGGGIYDDEIFAGVEWDLRTPVDALPISTPRFSFLAEYANDDINLGLRGRWRGLSATVGLFDFDRLGAGISYRAGLP